MGMSLLTNVLKKKECAQLSFRTGFIVFVLLATFAIITKGLKCKWGQTTLRWLNWWMGNFVACATTTRLHGAWIVVIHVIRVYPVSLPPLNVMNPLVAPVFYKVNALRIVAGLTVCTVLTMALAACTAIGHDTKPAKLKDAAQKNQREFGGLLVPWQTITGGWLTAKLDQQGFPLPGSPQGFASLIAPSALAVRGADLYIADSGSRKLYRVDTATQSMSLMPGIEVLPWTQIQLGFDHSLYVLDSKRQTILHFTRGMQPLPTLGNFGVGSVSLKSFVLDASLGQVVASDSISRRLVLFSPLGGPPQLLDTSTNGFRAMGALATDGRIIYALDSACFCIAVMDDTGRFSERIGEGVLAQPRALAADRYGHIFVADNFDRTLKIFKRGTLYASYKAQTLGLIEISALAVDEDVIYIADAAGSRVISLRIQTPMGGQQ